VAVRSAPAAVVALRTERSRAARARPVRRTVTGRQAVAPQKPFAVLMLAVLCGGLVGLLLLNSATAADSFAQHRLQEETAALTVREQELGRQVAAMEAPGALAAQARRLGLVPIGTPGYLVVGPDGSSRVVGTPTAPPRPAPASPSPTRPRPAARTATETPAVAVPTPPPPR